MNIENAKQIYASHPEMRSYLDKIFTKEEMQYSPSFEEVNKFFIANILSNIDMSKTEPTDSFSRIQLRDFGGNWLFDYEYDEKRPHFWYNDTNVTGVMREEFHLTGVELGVFMHEIKVLHFHMQKDTPILSCAWL